jgi:transketolase
MRKEYDTCASETSKAIREKILRMAFLGQSVHIPSAFSVVEILDWVFESHISTATKPLMGGGEGDRLVLSKGHGVMALYAILALNEIIAETHLENYFSDGSLLPGLCESRIPGCEVNSGSLGQGLSVAVGMALGAKKLSQDNRFFVVVGDGELNEGSIWEAFAFAVHNKLSNLTIIVDANGFQALGSTREVMNLTPLVQKCASFGLKTVEADGHSKESMRKAFAEVTSDSDDSPQLIVAHTVKGKGISFMESENSWHYRRLDEPTYKRALKELCR